MTITFNLQNLGPSELDEAQALLNLLRRSRVRGEAKEVITRGRRSRGLVSRWLQRLGKGSLAFWNVAATQSQAHGEWTFADLVARSGEPLNTLRSQHRNSYRAIKAEGADDPFTSRWDAAGGRRVYSMPNYVRDEILRLAPALLAKFGGKSNE
jgi:hypothetical protein